VNTSWWLTVAEAGRITSRPRTTALPLLSSRRLARGSNMSCPPGMMASPPTRASTSRKIRLVTTAVLPGPGTPRDQERGSLQRLQPGGIAGSGRVDAVPAARAGGTVVVEAPSVVSEASSGQTR
jgi:hypothetical protein